MAEASDRKLRNRSASLRTLAVTTAAACMTFTIYANSVSGHLDRVNLIKGWDFPQFYAMGVLAAERRWSELQSGASLSGVVADRVTREQQFHFVPVYGPQVALLFWPLAGLSYLHARWVWTATSLILVAIAVGLVIGGENRRHAPVLWLVSATWPAVFLLAWTAQLSAVSLLCAVGVYKAAAGRQWLLAGVALGALVFKPHLGAVLWLWLAYERQWAALAAAACSAVSQLLVASWFAGPAVMMQYVGTLSAVVANPSPVQGKPYILQTFRQFYVFLVGEGRLALLAYGLTVLLVLALLFAAWRGHPDVRTRFVAAIFATVLVSPHFYHYDLLLLLPALLWCAADHLEGGAPEWMRTAVIALYLLPVAAPVLALATRVQVTPPALTALLVAVLVSGRPRSGPVTSPVRSSRRG